MNNTGYITGCFLAGSDVADYELFRLSLANFQEAISLSFSPPYSPRTLEKFNRNEGTIVHISSLLILKIMHGWFPSSLFRVHL